jgi:hypothetical protein
LTLHTTQLAALKLPHLTTRNFHERHVQLLAGQTAVFDSTGQWFQNLSSGAVWGPEKYRSLADMKKFIPEALFNALSAISDLYPMSDGLGAWAMSTQLLMNWQEAVDAVFKQRSGQSWPQRWPVAGLGIDMVLTLAQDVVNTLPSDGPTLRGMQAAMEHWKEIWRIQYEMIEAEVR